MDNISCIKPKCIVYDTPNWNNYRDTCQTLANAVHDYVLYLDRNGDRNCLLRARGRSEITSDEMYI